MLWTLIDLSFKDVRSSCAADILDSLGQFCAADIIKQIQK